MALSEMPFQNRRGKGSPKKVDSSSTLLPILGVEADPSMIWERRALAWLQLGKVENPYEPFEPQTLRRSVHLWWMGIWSEVLK